MWSAGNGGKVCIMSPAGYVGKSHVYLNCSLTILINLITLNYLCTLTFGKNLDIERFDNFHLRGSTNINLTDFSLLINNDVCNVAKVRF